MKSDTNEVRASDPALKFSRTTIDPSVARHASRVTLGESQSITSADSNEEDEPRSAHFTSTRNACKLCTPLGACLAFRGVEGCIPFLHGSQGCATYIRRYLISHFREPIDIASSNFHEESAVFGGRSNFLQGVRNVVAQYQPQLVGVATTCLAETIGEDMPGLLREIRSGSDRASVPPLVQVSTAAYRGTHIDGFHGAVRAMVEQLAKPGPPSHWVNLLPGMVSAADLRHLKEILGDFGLNYTLLPDYSETMDGETWSQYEKLQAGGTRLADIAAMGRARATLEFGRVLEATPTAGRVLHEQCQVPRHLLGLPIGVRESDRFFALLAAWSGKPVPPEYLRERGRLVDSFIDGHKYLFEKRALVYGEEDLVIGLTAFLTEIGVTPVLCASGGRSQCFEKCLREAAPDLPAETLVKEGFDFAEMAEIAASLKPDFLLGSSKGYSLARKLHAPLIRVGFPIHDRVGGQRVLHLGYRGAQQLFDRLVNALIESRTGHLGSRLQLPMNDAPNPTPLRGHPCFDAEARHRFGRIHLPVAPRCNLQCNFCNRKFDCINESRPGVTSAVLTPPQALAYLTDVVAQRPEIAVVGLAGPGDPFANPVETMETLRLVHEKFPSMLLCVATNGLGIGPHIDELARLKVSHVTITIAALDPKIGAEIYAWIRDGKRPLRGEAAAAVLLERQLDAIRRLKAHDVVVKVNSILIPGINDEHIPDIAKAMAELGVDIMNVVPLVHVEGAVFEDIEPPDGLMISRLRLQCGLHLPQMSHCARCRADAVGFIGETRGRRANRHLESLRHHDTQPR